MKVIIYKEKSMKVLADWLKKDYEIKEGKVVSKVPFACVINGVEVKIPVDETWVQTFSKSGNKDLIVSAIPTLTHSYCLSLASEYKDIVKLNGANRHVHLWPNENEDLHGYVTISNEDGCWADGEVHRSTVNESMYPYINTILMKRAEDRLILRALGLYSQGFYSKEEFGGVESYSDVDEVTAKSTNSLTKDDIAKKVAADRKKAVKQLVAEITSLDELFDFKAYCTNLLNKEPNERWTNYTDDDFITIFNGLTNSLQDLRKG